MSNTRVLLLTVCMIATTSIFCYAQKASHTSLEIIQLTQKALGGESFFTPKPYSLTYTAHMDDSGEVKTIKYNASFKDKKYHTDSTVSIRGKKPFNVKTIVNLNDGKAWESVNGGKYSETSDYRNPEIPCFGKKTMDSLLFETPIIVKQNGVDYYKLDANYGEARYKDYRVTYLIDCKTNLIYEFTTINTKNAYRSVKIFTDYTQVDSIMVPQKRKIEETYANGSKLVEEGTISNFKFRNDLNNKLFEVPKK